MMEFTLKVNEGEVQLIAAGLVSLANTLNAKLQAQVNEQFQAQKPPEITKRTHKKRGLKLVPSQDKQNVVA